MALLLLDNEVLWRLTGVCIRVVWLSQPAATVSEGAVRGGIHWKCAAYAITPKCSTLESTMSLALSKGSTPSLRPALMPANHQDINRALNYRNIFN